MKNRRKVELVVLSDTHLGTQGCRSEELLLYLQSIKPQTLILNGDIIDIWQFKKRYFPKSHLKIVKRILDLASKQTQTYYIAGNHDDLLRKFDGFKIGKLHFVNQLELTIEGKKAWFFHGDVFDVVMQYSPWLSKLGAIGYDSLIWLNGLMNRISRLLGKGPVSFSKKIKESVKGAVKFITNFEETAAIHAIKKDIDIIVCGHIHKAEKRSIQVQKQSITYLNSGDWIENLTALEFHDGEWSIFSFSDHFPKGNRDENRKESKVLEDYDTKELYQLMVKQFQENGMEKKDMPC